MICIFLKKKVNGTVKINLIIQIFKAGYMLHYGCNHLSLLHNLTPSRITGDRSIFEIE